MSKLTRRDVLATVGAAAIGGALSPAAADEEVNPEALARFEALIHKYGDRFDEKQKAEIRKRIIDNQAGIESMRAYPLDNSVEPATLFRVHRNARPRLRLQPHARRRNRDR